MKQRALSTTLLSWAVVLGMLGYFGVQVARFFDDPISTALAYSYQVERVTPVSGYVIRQERLLARDDSGLLRQLRQEGERVSAGGVVAAVYADQASLDKQAEIETLNARIQQLQFAQEAEDSLEAAQKLDTQIRTTLLDYRAALTSDRLDDMEQKGATLRTQILKRDYTGAGMQNLQEELTALRKELRTLKAQAAGSVRQIKAPQSGLYSAVVDGYETVLTPEMLDTLTPSRLSTLKPDNDGVTYPGKLVLGDVWYYAAVMPVDEAELLQKRKQEGGDMILRFNKGVGRDLSVTLHSVSSKENGRCVVIFMGREYLAQLTLLRHQSAQIITGTTEGIRVPESALRVMTVQQTHQDGTVTESQRIGVYCVMGVEARFKPVEVLYVGEGFALVRPDVSVEREGQRIRNGDQVIVAARNLYNGKVVLA